MCGIVGYTGKNNAKDIILSSLKNLEYRGYDSAGIGVFLNNKITLFKSKGNITNLENLLKYENINSNCGIGHTRWATHGIPDEKNAHPHKHGSVTLVHNGIIENYIELKDFLLKEGIKFYSNTDTEVACAYINYIYIKTNDKLRSIKEACDKFRGSYAFGIIFDDEPGAIYATRLNSPLIIGIGDNENFISSDILAILDYTNKYILLNHNEFAKITQNNIFLLDNNFNELQYTVNVANLSATEYKKNGYDHFMLKEINEQPYVITNIFDNFFNKTETILNTIDFSKFTSIDIVACGSAMHAGLVGKYFLEKYANIKTNVEIASEYRYKYQIYDKNSLVIIVSQSGETADSLAALRLAKENNIFVLSIINAQFSSIARESDACIYTNAGPEIAVATTKGYTTQVAIFAILALKIAQQKNITTNFNDIQSSYKNYEKIFQDTINKDIIYKEIAKKIYTSPYLFYIGRGIDSALTMEGSLKLKEISYIHAESYAAGELKHGTISLIEDDTPVIAIATDKHLIEKTISNIKEVKTRGAYTIFITTENFKYINTSDFADITLYLPNINDIINPINVAISLQLIAYETAKLKGCDIDKPKNLAKSVTVE
jgi:glucosamine--fructose-6-phosphate aminotransferase (isomerizing)